MAVNPHIYCDVNNCRFNHEGKACTLDTIQVGTRCHDKAKCQEDSMCCSFRQQA